MASTFFGLNIAYTGLTAANAALNTTANNISNTNTEGYSRQLVSQQAANSLRTYTTYGCSGAGVETTSIERQRDAFYDFKYWNNNASKGEYSELEYYMKQIEDSFKDDSTVEGFSTIFQKMYTMIQELDKNSGDPVTKTQFLGFAGNLTYYFNNMAGKLSTLQSDCNQELKNVVSQINSYAEEIASLNQQINVIELSGSMANELRDQRDLLIDKLSELVDVTTEEQPVYDTNNSGRETGATRYVVKIAGGQTLVDSSSYNSLECRAREIYAGNNQSDVAGLYDVFWKDGRDFSLASDQIGGQLRGLIEIRDGNNGENFNGKVKEIGVNADGKTTVKVDISADYLRDLSACTLPIDGGILKLGSKEYYFDSFEANYAVDADGNPYIESYNFIISKEPEKNATQPDISRVGQDASVGYSIDYQGIPYYQEQLNEWCRLFAEAFNKIVTQDGAVDGYGNKPDVVFVADNAVDDKQNTFLASRQTIKAGTVISSKDDSYYYLTAKNFNVNSGMLDDPRLMATHTGNPDEESKSDIVDQLIALRTDTSVMSFRGCGAGDFLQCVLADVALNTQSSSTLHSSYDNISKAIDSQRLSVYGVDTDEEALNLVQYQHAYNLASQMISVLSEVYDRLILQTGV